MSHTSQKQEMQDAKEQNRIPKCTYCNHDIKCITQLQDERIIWKWDDGKKTYTIDYSGSADPPVHQCEQCSCEDEDWDYLDENSKADLGVSF